MNCCVYTYTDKHLYRKYDLRFPREIASLKYVPPARVVVQSVIPQLFGPVLNDPVVVLADGRLY